MRLIIDASHGALKYKEMKPCISPSGKLKCLSHTKKIIEHRQWNIPYLLSKTRFGKILNLLWKICCIAVTNGQILKNNLTIWSHCTCLLVNWADPVVRSSPCSSIRGSMNVMNYLYLEVLDSFAPKYEAFLDRNNVGHLVPKITLGPAYTHRKQKTFIFMDCSAYRVGQ